VVLAGGGARNPVLAGRLREHLAGQAVVLSDELGVPVEARESAGFAVLGALSRDGVPISLPQITGASDPGVAGHWVFPGATK
jgi:anhydro-N-acetylmuramic acid kinase